MAVNKIKQYTGTFEYIYTPQRPAAYAANGGDISLFTSEIGGGGRNVKGATYRVHKFTNSSDITFDQAGYVDILVVAGGGAGGASYNYDMGGGGGAGGLIERYNHYVEATTYSINVGAGGIPTNGTAANATGSNSSFGNVVALGGGRGSNRYANNNVPGAVSGGSGGGGADNSDSGASGTEGQGFSGGNGWSDISGGGGGAGGSGGSPGEGFVTCFGGDGRPTYFDNDSGDWMAGGGAGSYRNSRRGDRGPASGGRGGGGDGGSDGDSENNRTGRAATYYGSGGAAGFSKTTSWYYGGAGYQGIVIVRYLIT